MTTATETTTTDQQSRWKKIIKDWESSNQSQKVFCEAHHLIYHQFGYWRRKFLKQHHDHNPSPRSGFATVSYPRSIASSGLSLQLPNGLVLQGIAADNVGVAYQLISKLS